MVNYSNDELLNGILRNDSVILQFIYKNFYYKINFFIKKNSGDDDDANDIFQEAIIIIYRKLKENKLVLDCSFDTYLYSICRFLWLKQLDKRKNERERIYDNQEYRDDIYDDYLNRTVEDERKIQVVSKAFSKSGKRLPEDTSNVFR